MSWDYDLYLKHHKENVAKGFRFIRDELPELLIPMPNVDYEWQICTAHDYSKSDAEEYAAYDKYFYGNNRSFQVVQDFNYAWLHHIHANKHHWQHWVLINDDPGEGEKILDMPYNYILEMICDWWAFGFAQQNLYEIFKWYDKHKDYMKLSSKTRVTVDDILDKIHKKLDELRLTAMTVEAEDQSR